MGYYTSYELSVHQGTADLDAVIERLAMVMELDSEDRLFRIVHDSIESDEAMTWYDHDSDVAEMSRFFPGVVFKLHGEGEESGDLWDAYYKDGKCQICRGILRYPPYDPQRLKSVIEAQKEDQQ